MARSHPLSRDAVARMAVEMTKKCKSNLTTQLDLSLWAGTDLTDHDRNSLAEVVEAITQDIAVALHANLDEFRNGHTAVTTAFLDTIEEQVQKHSHEWINSLIKVRLYPPFQPRMQKKLCDT
jgi:hypothetical protein